MKRGIDVFLAGLALVPALPVMVIIGLLLWATQGRPVLFTQRRSGKDSRAFRLYKFRSMTSAKDKTGRLLADGARTTRIGWWLRRTRLDELPQLVHVLVGDMSLVGPRPVLPETVAAFGEWGEKRGWVRPGLTGWAQVNGNALLEPRDKIALDLWYIDNRSIQLDALIIVKTLAVIVFGDRINPVTVREALHHQYGADAETATRAD